MVVHLVQSSEAGRVVYEECWLELQSVQILKWLLPQI